MSNARTLFEKLDLSYIEQEMIGKSFENNWLECKTKQGRDPNGLDESDVSNFAKSLSGFANTSGGVLVFGLDARREDAVDIIQSIKSIKNLKKIESAFREKESRIVERTVPGVEYKSIETGCNEGMIAIYIPESAHPPHRSLKSKDFYIRAGGNFVPLDINFIEDLFYRRLRPKLEFIVKRLPGWRFIVSLANNGEATAKNPYIVYKQPPKFNHDDYELDGNTRLRSWIDLKDFQGLEGRFVAFVGGDSRPVHPGCEIELLQLKYQINEPIDEKKFLFEYYLYAENMPPEKGEIII